MQTDHEWQRPIRWAYDEPHCLCPLTEQEAERAAAWAEVWADHHKPANMTARHGQYIAPPKVQATEHEGEMALAYVRQQMSAEELERFIETGEWPYSMSSMGSGSFTDESDPLVSHHIGHDGRGINARRPSAEGMASDREWHGFWKPRRYQQHNPGHQAYAPQPKPYSQDEGRWEIKWSQIRALLRAERDAALQAELQPSLF